MGLAWSSVASKLVGPDLAMDVRLKLLASALVDEVIAADDAFEFADEEDAEVFKSFAYDGDSGQCWKSARNSIGSEPSITRVTRIEYCCFSSNPFACKKPFKRKIRSFTQNLDQ